MPKMKTHKATAKRFRITGSGKIRRRKQGGNHLRRKKTKRSKRKYSQKLPVSDADEKRIKQILSTG
ncbi:MAG: 50S ribosomal protein L35 [Chloroflexota bacterium]|nr:50S ribosomal protein L35 [Chloroflexota bacterium]